MSKEQLTKLVNRVQSILDKTSLGYLEIDFLRSDCVALSTRKKDMIYRIYRDKVECEQKFAYTEEFTTDEFIDGMRSLTECIRSITEELRNSSL